MRAWIIGYRSFIGQHLDRHLRNLGVEVIGYGREQMQDPDGFEVPENIDFIYNLAAAGSKSGKYTDDEMYWTNVHQVYELLDATKNMDYKAFIHFGTSSEYGKKNGAMYENDYLDPEFMYAGTKAAATMLCKTFAKVYEKPIVVVRPFTVYGPKMQESKLIPVLFKKIKNGEKIQLVKGEHDFIYIDDVLSALDCVRDNSSVLKSRTVNIGTGIGTTNEEVARVIGEILGDDPDIEEVDSLSFHSHSLVDSPVWRADCRVLRNFSWKPKYSLINGLIKMYGES